MNGSTGDELFLLPCDHRSILRGLYAAVHPDAAEMDEWVSTAKQVVLDGLVQAETMGIPASSMGLLIDEEYGSDVARRAMERGISVFMPVDFGELGPFELQYGDDFIEHVERQAPDYVTALVEYAPEDPQRSDQLRRLEPLLTWLQTSGFPFLLELQVPPTADQLAAFGGDREAWVKSERPGQIARAIAELRAAGASPRVWKIEACATEGQYVDVTEAMRSDGEAGATMVVLGAGAGVAEVSDWLRVAAKVPACIGFAVGRTVWLDALTAFAAGSLDHDAAAADIAGKYSQFCRVFRSARF